MNGCSPVNLAIPCEEATAGAVGGGGQGSLEMVSIILTSVRRLPLGKEKTHIL